MRFLLGMCAFFTLPLWANTQLTTQIHDIDHGDHIADEALVFLTSGQVAKLNVQDTLLHEQLSQSVQNKSWLQLELNDEREILSATIVPVVIPEKSPENLKSIMGPDPMSGYNASVITQEKAKQIFREARHASKEETQCFNRANFGNKCFWAEENTWSGFRTLTDQEIATLAEKIVVQVKKRGPFMSLADFVNRPLVAPVGYANWTQSELDYLGTIESAIAASNLNSRFDDSLMDRSSPDSGTRPAAVGTLRNPEFRSRHKIAGAPGYLEQSDILQQVGSALNARSDTFTVRAMGEYEGAISYVELTVQRFPEPMRTGVNNLPVNPLAVLPAASLEYAGNQFFGRRMKVLATRWLTSEEI